MFVLSDFVVPPDLARLGAGARAPLGARARAHPGRALGAELPGGRRDHVPYADPRTGRVVPVYVSAREAERLRTEHESRWDGLMSEFRSLGIEPVVVHSHDRGDLLASFLRWADLRQMWRGAVG